MRAFFPCLLTVLASALMSPLPTRAAPPDALAQGFSSPPDSARPQTWWHWMNGNVTAAGITADLEAMKRVGLGGAEIFTVDQGIPAGPAPFMGPEYRKLITYAVKEADRLGLKLCLHNCAGWSSSGGPWIAPEYAMQVVTTSERRVSGPLHFSDALAQPPTKQNFYRDIAILAFPTPVGETDGPTKNAIPNFRAKADYERGDNIAPASDGPASPAVRPAGEVNLTARFANGQLTWDVPAGAWTILRVGYTPTGETNHPAPPEGLGLECDKLSRAAMDVHFAGMMQKLLDDAGPLVGKSLNNALIDSYEVGSQNWTPAFRAEFARRRGYDLLPFLPVFTGRVVDNSAVTERFLWDLRRTVADLMRDNYFGYFGELCHKRGLLFSTEGYGNGPFEDLAAGGRADIPMGEFWVGGAAAETGKLASSAAHTYGHTFVGAESFTADPAHGKWQNDPYSLKALGDRMYCAGINRFIFHRYAMQPWLDRRPGMTMGPWGFHFERTNTWWQQGAAWLTYLSRCQDMLQQGLFVADACYLSGENAPVGIQSSPALPAGFDYDGASPEVVLTRMSVKHGRLVLPDGMSYRILILPPGDTMTPALLRKIRQLVRDGATVVGPKPTRSPSLQDYPRCDREVKTLADELWGRADGTRVTEHGLGKGRVIWGQTLTQVFAARRVAPDFELAGRSARLTYIHRAVGGADIYFVSNQRATAVEVPCTFRVSGRVPELWRPDTGQREQAPLYADRDGRTTVPLHLDPSGSVFVVFRRKAGSADHAVSVVRTDGPDAPVPPTLEIQRAVYEAVDGAGSKDVTDIVRRAVSDGTLTIDVTNEALGGDPVNLHVKRLRVDYTRDGKPGTQTVAENDTLDIAGAGGGHGPSFRVRATPDGGTEVEATESGTYQVRTAGGRTLTAQVSAVAAPLSLAGPWGLRFPPRWGAPASVPLDALASWTENADAGVRYFSGTATYVKDIDVLASLLGPGKSLALDLGEVKNIAQVKLNGKDLGVLWKPPFRVDVSGAAHAGTNHLEIAITNLWPNRIIGDEQLPDDREWDGDHLRRWPQWLLDGKPSPTGRLTFTTWKHYDKNSPLLPSGLLGPVTLRPSLSVRVPPR